VVVRVADRVVVVRVADRVVVLRVADRLAPRWARGPTAFLPRGARELTAWRVGGGVACTWGARAKSCGVSADGVAPTWGAWGFVPRWGWCDRGSAQPKLPARLGPRVRAAASATKVTGATPEAAGMRTHVGAPWSRTC